MTLWTRIEQRLGELASDLLPDETAESLLARGDELAATGRPEDARAAYRHTLRAAAGDRVIKIEGSYHGHHDQLMFSVVPSMGALGPPERPWVGPFSRGIPKRIEEDLVVVPFNDADALQRILEEDAASEGGRTIGAMIIEPVMMNIGIVEPQPGYLQALRDASDKHGAVLIYDEVKCGGTIAYGGTTERYGVKPHLAAYAIVPPHLTSS